MLDQQTKFRGWMFIGFSNEFPKGRIKERTYMHEDCLAFRSESGQLNLVEPFCSHFGVNMATGKVVKDLIQCPMHGRTFHGDGRCGNSKYRSIRSYPVHEDNGLAFAWFDRAGVAPQWEPPSYFEEEFPDVLWHHHRYLSLHHPSVPQDNAVDPRHFEFTHAMFGRQLEEGRFEADGHKAIGTMATQILPPLSWASGDRSVVTSWYDGPLNNRLTAAAEGHKSELVNLLTIIEGRRCKLTQIGIGRRSLNPLRKFRDVVGMAASWYATREDAPVWNDRKVQPLDPYPHDTDKAILQFREWFDGFAYDEDVDGPLSVADIRGAEALVARAEEAVAEASRHAPDKADAGVA